MTTTLPQSIASEIQKLDPSAIIELFELDMSVVGGQVVHYHGGTNSLYEPVVWQGVTYFAFPVQASGFEYNGNGQLPRPKLQISNATGAISALILTYGDLVGCKLTRRRTFARFLDAVNFPAGNPDADPTAEFPDDVFFLEQRTSETRDMVEFQLSASFDFQGVTLPRRQIVQNVCTWTYRVWNDHTLAFDYTKAECPYTGTAYFDTNDVETTAASDRCGRRLTSCKARFGSSAQLPFGSFPACGIST